MKCEHKQKIELFTVCLDPKNMSLTEMNINNPETYQIYRCIDCKCLVWEEEK